MPLTYCFAGSDIKARWHVAFWERSGAPSRLPVHLHNVATCHMETGITNLCLSHVAGRSSYSRSCPNFIFFPPTCPLSFHRRLLPVSPSCLLLPRSLLNTAFFVNAVEIITAGNKKHDFPHARHKRTKPAGGGVGVQGPHVNTSCEDCGDREKG